jgi:leucyl aminopeptidase (aminopeptidase T)
MSLNLKKIFVDVFAPEQADSVLFIIDTPHRTPDDEAWQARRQMAKRWQEAMERLSKELGFSVFPIAHYPDVAQHNNSLPDAFEVEGDWIKVKTMVESASLVIAMTKWSATAPLHEWVQNYKGLRAASLPGVSPQMEETALKADYAQIATYCRILQPKLDSAKNALIHFSTDDELFLDLRWRKAHVDDGRLHPSDIGKVINLPSGEVFSTLYEGEKKEAASLTNGILPIVWDHSVVRLLVEHNTVVDVLSHGEASESLRTFLEEDAARKNLAELGLGCNPAAVVTGNILEDEKVGPHIALGRSDHLGGTVGPALFKLDPWHQDFSYTSQSPVTIDSMIFNYEDSSSETIVSRGRYARHLGVPL